MRAIWSGVLCALVAAPGCLSHPRPAEKAPRGDGGAALMPRQTPPVTPDQVTEGNARQQLRALQEEIDRARGQVPAAPSPGGPAEE